ncbi:isoform 5 of pogo transposable element with ZNF domain [Aspergillus lentulus]|nr:isoform 5 of pogo transposable element with ZNF domain [Aspergillus lentulus]
MYSACHYATKGRKDSIYSMSFEKEGILNIREAARAYNLPYTTLQRRLTGRTGDLRANSLKMT